jgi:hypothetical protein
MLGYDGPQKEMGGMLHKKFEIGSGAVLVIIPTAYI